MEIEVTHLKPREDAVVDPYTRRRYVPTEENTKWVHNWEEFRLAGGRMHFNGDQTEIYLSLPVGYKFSIKFMDE